MIVKQESCGPSLPCPFCGGPSQIVRFDRYEHKSDYHPKSKYWRVVCLCCGANTGRHGHKTEAVNTWEARQ